MESKAKGVAFPLTNELYRYHLLLSSTVWSGMDGLDLKTVIHLTHSVASISWLTKSFYKCTSKGGDLAADTNINEQRNGQKAGGKNGALISHKRIIILQIIQS